MHQIMFTIPHCFSSSIFRVLQQPRHLFTAGCSQNVRAVRNPVTNCHEQNLRRQKYSTCHQKPIVQDISSRRAARNKRYAKAAAYGYLGVVWWSWVSIVAANMLNYDYHTEISSPGYLEDDEREDMRDVVLVQTLPSVARVSKPTSPHYETLVQKDEIRLLVLHPGEPQDQIMFHLEHVTLRTNDRMYEALSYVWGGDTATQNIAAVEGHQIPVTGNLLSALQHLRHRDHTRTLWIDALCIDQTDIDERSHRVRLMGDVYAKADRVVIWLGEECHRTARAFSSLEDVYANSWHPGLWHVKWVKQEANRHLIKRFATMSVSRRLFDGIGVIGWDTDENSALDVKNIDWIAIHALLLRPWFHRLWVIQEISNAKRAIVVCGHATISWTVLAKSLTYLVKNDLTKTLDPICGLACNSVASIQQIRRQRVKHSLFTVALDHTHGGCRDARDKIFALMSIAAGRDLFDWEVSFDYTLPVEELYKRFALWDISRNDTFRAISCETSAPTNSAELSLLPSWVPDWTRL
jgi:hypothetical protein